MSVCYFLQSRLTRPISNSFAGCFINKISIFLIINDSEGQSRVDATFDVPIQYYISVIISDVLQKY